MKFHSRLVVNLHKTGKVESIEVQEFAEPTYSSVLGATLSGGRIESWRQNSRTGVTERHRYSDHNCECMSPWYIPRDPPSHIARLLATSGLEQIREIVRSSPFDHYDECTVRTVERNRRRKKMVYP